MTSFVRRDSFTSSIAVKIHDMPGAGALYRRAMPFSLVDFLQALAAGVLVGATYALMCVGLGIIFGAMRVINFA